MKIIVDRTVILPRPPLALSTTDDGNPVFTLTHDGVQMQVICTPEEARGLGVQLIENGAIGKLIKSQSPAAAPTEPPGRMHG